MGSVAMCEDVGQNSTWLNSLMRKVGENLGKDFNDARYELSDPDESFFISSMFFVNITANASNGGTSKKRIASVVVKRPPSQPTMRQMMNSDAQFHNEILFYRRYAVGHDDLPKCIYADEKPPTESVVVLHNIGQQGFKLCQWKYRAPLEYTVAAIQEIARFHANGYVMKERNRDEFFDFVRSIQETRFESNPENIIKVVINASMNRGVDYLREHGHGGEFYDKLRSKFENGYRTVVLEIVKPEEPLATLCHGDFTLNNTFFKREDGQLKVMFIDFALIRYGSPIVDLSTFLSLHCAEELDKDMIDNALKVYHDSLRQCLAENGIEDCERFSYEAVHDDYKRKGIFGYIIASFFLAMLMGKCEMTTEEMVALDIEEQAKLIQEVGGDEISEILGNMLLKLKEFGCLDDIV